MIASPFSAIQKKSLWRRQLELLELLGMGSHSGMAIWVVDRHGLLQSL